MSGTRDPRLVFRGGLGWAAVLGLLSACGAGSAEPRTPAARNERLHGVSFDEATELFATDALVLEVYDAEHSDTEDRFKSIGPIERGLVLVVWTERTDDVIRIISAWWATPTEQQLYREFTETTT